MRHLVAWIAITTAMAVSGSALGASEGTNSPQEQLRLEVRLADGSLVIGTPGIPAAPLRTPYARMDIPFNQVRTIVAAADQEAATMSLQNGDRLRGVISCVSLPLVTLFGPVSIAIEHVRQIDVISGTTALQGDLVVRGMPRFLRGSKMGWGDGPVDGSMPTIHDILDVQWTFPKDTRAVRKGDGAIYTNELPTGWWLTDKDAYFAIIESRASGKSYRVGMSVRSDDTVEIDGTRYWVVDIRPFSRTVLLKNTVSGELVLLGPRGRQSDGAPLKSYEPLDSAPRSVAWGEPVNGLRLGLQASHTTENDRRLTATLYVGNESGQACLLPPVGFWVWEDGSYRPYRIAGCTADGREDPSFRTDGLDRDQMANAPVVQLMPGHVIAFSDTLWIEEGKEPSAFRAVLDTANYWKNAPAAQSGIARPWIGRCSSGTQPLPTAGRSQH
jgi:hypothetical protein